MEKWIGSRINLDDTHTHYDIPAYNPSPAFSQENLRNRVASVTLEVSDDSDSLTYDIATHYTYDISGNVSSIIQEDKFLESIGQSLKRIDYDYDLVSGKVNYVYYQKDSVDQFIHHYEYDDDNRITHVYTSRDAMLWDEDAHYKYYLHGPLARVELGQQKVQGVDYAYTLQGWMKGINASILDTTSDMGNDGTWPPSGFSRDAYGFSLGYFYQDYKQIDPSNNFQADYTADGTGSTFGTASFGSTTSLGLYNGNIRHSVLSMDSMNYPNIGYVYQYDQLNRLKEMNAYAGLVTDSNDWNTDPVLDDYKELIDFDPNGNILNYLRRGTTTGGNPLDMDSMVYKYNSGNNQLEHVTEYVSDGNYSNDIDDQSSGNYLYDANGNLIQDIAEGITMTWWNNGKLQSVKKASGDSLGFAYDPTGNRIMKAFYNDATDDSLYTFYVRDGQGNIMATYEWKNEDTLQLVELDIYGSSRVGMLMEDTLVGCVGCTAATSSGSASLWTGKKMFELTNHLGNVLSTITDKKIYCDANSDSTADYSIPEIASQQDYYPFGMSMPGRSLSLGNYRFGFNGKENDNEISGKGNFQDYGMRGYLLRLGRFPSVDPITKNYPELTPYQFACNNPIKYIDIDGKEAGEPGYHSFKAGLAVTDAEANKAETQAVAEPNDPGIRMIGKMTENTLDGTFRFGSSLVFGLVEGYYFAATEKRLSSFVFGFSWNKGFPIVSDPESNQNTKKLMKSTVTIVTSILPITFTQNTIVNFGANFGKNALLKKALDAAVPTQSKSNESSQNNSNVPPSPDKPTSNPPSNNKPNENGNNYGANNDGSNQGQNNKGGGDNAYSRQEDSYSDAATLYPRPKKN